EGLVQKNIEPMGFGVRCDGYVYEGFEIPIYYDPLISKLVTWGKTRKEAIERMKRALRDYSIMGIKTSLNFLHRIMETPDFYLGKYNTYFIEKNKDFLFTHGLEKNEAKRIEDLAMITAFLEYNTQLTNGNNIPLVAQNNQWKDFGRKKGVQQRL
ncbi:MAG: acetyl-CoA carboxylase biotin carboxylase subunit, partial [Bacteroidetes bacterium]|nr:acetyl-CoA carboxylase biotin carboxylase subunit [Bacteroidota bacterium]